MREIVIEKQAIQTKLPKDFVYDNYTLTIPKNITFQDPIKITILDDHNESLKIVVSENTSIKIILEVHNDTLDASTYHFDLLAKKNSHVKYLLVSELKSKKGLVEHYFTAERDAKLDLLGGFVSDVLDAKMHVDLIGEGSEVKTCSHLTDENKQNIDVLIIHKAPNTIGNMTNIGIANKKGKIILNGVEKN